jgi:hypothetical protein
MGDLEETEFEPADSVNRGGVSSPGTRPRRKLVMTLTVIAVLVGFLSIMSTWVLRQTLETGTWNQTSEKMVQNEEIRQALSVYLVDELYANVDVESEVKSVLPPELKGLAGPAAGQLRQLADKAAYEALSRPAVQSIWVTASDSAHTALVDILEGGSTNVSTSGGDVVINVKGMLEQVTADIGVGSNLVAKLPADTGQIEVFKSSELEEAQTAVDAFQVLDWVIYLIALGLFALAVFLAKGWRRAALRNVGIGLIVLGIVTLLVRSAAGNALVSALAGDSDYESAVNAAWGIATDELARIARTVIFSGVLLIIGAWLAGPMKLASRIRSGTAPYLAEPRIVFPAVLVLLIVLTWWSPWGVMDRVEAVVLVALYLFIGAEVLRREVNAEFPEEAGSENRARRRGERIESVKQGAAGAWKRTSTAVAGIGSSRRGKQASADSEAARLERLRQLAALKESGALTDEEFAAEKRRLLATRPEADSGN